MDLVELRNEINDIDKDILELFIKRMGLCVGVAEYKIENNLPVFQTDREKAIIEKVRGNSPEWLKESSELLFTTIMDISKSHQYNLVFEKENKMDYLDFSDILKNPVVACPGTEGSYSHLASKQIFSEGKNLFYEDFEYVFEAVSKGDADFGIMPLQNSTAGSVNQAYELLKKHNCYISASTKVKVSHCFAIKKGTDVSNVKKIFSHEQALAQCSEFIKANGYLSEKYSNTALAAEYINESNEPYGVICSVECAERLGLEIISSQITNETDNYTRFILLSKDIYSSKEADVISVSLSLPHTKSSLYRLLTKFSVAGLNLTRIESRPVASRDFDVVFYLDFEGSLKNPQVSKIVAELQSELSYFKFLGNYKDV